MDASYSKTIENYTAYNHEYAVVVFQSGYPTLENSIKNILHQEQADYMTDVKATFNWWFIPLIYYNYELRITGKLWKKDQPLPISILGNKLEN